MEKWYKKSYVCGGCDALVIITTKSDSLRDNNCIECGWDLNLMSVADATIYPTTKKEETMDTLSTEYNPNLLVTYKKITNGETEYKTEKVTDIEWLLENSRKNNERNIEMNNKVFKLENMLSSYCQEATDPDMEFITEIAETFGISLTKDIEIVGTMSFSATITVNITEDYDIESLAQDALQVSSWGGDVEVDDYSVEDVREAY
jgi:DNA-directed RNA polymerase subunit RPC12/RpoP